MSVVKFSDHYTPVQFEGYKAATDAWKVDTQNKALAEAWFFHSESLVSSLVSYLKARAQASELDMIAFSDRRGLPFVDAWNRMVNLEKPGPWDDGLLFENYGTSLSVLEGKMASYGEFVTAAEQAGPFTFSAGDCMVTGERMFVAMKGWKPLLGSLKPVDGKRSFVPLMQDAALPSVKHIEIPVPSGQLLIADWFRIPAFNEVVKANEGHPSLPSVNTVAGQQITSEAYAKRHGFISVCVGNTSPSVVASGPGQFCIASTEDDILPASVKNLGSVCTDLWWVTVIDRKVLTDIVASKIGQKAAEAQVEQYLKESSGDILTVNIPSGQPLHAYFESEEGLQGRFEAEGVTTKGFETLYAVLSTKPLTWSDCLTQDVKKKPGLKA